MQPAPKKAGLNVIGKPSEMSAAQVLAGEESRHCPYCYETISVNAKKCWRCHEYFAPPREDLDDRMFQLARREVLQDCLIDIKKWITRIGIGSVAGLLLIGTLSLFRFQDMLEDMVAQRVEVVSGPVLVETEEKLDETEEVLDDVHDNIRLAQHRISQFDEMDDKLVQTHTAIAKIENAKQGLESRAQRLATQFEQLESRVISAKRELRDDRDRKLEETLGEFASQVVTYDKLQAMLTGTNAPQNRELLTALTPMQFRRISLISPFTLSSGHPTVVFLPSVRLEWHFENTEVGEVLYRVHYDTRRDFKSNSAGVGTTRLTNLTLPQNFPHGPVYWRVEAVDAQGVVQATSDVGYFEYYANSLDRIRSTGVIRIGVACAAQSEFAYFDENQGQLTGYDIELSRWLAARLMPSMPEVRPVFIGYTWNRLLETVHRNEVDFIISTITITPQREEEYGLRFSKPYYSTRQACVVCEKGTIHTATDLHQRRIAVQAGTSSEPVGEAFTESTNLMRVPSTEVAFEKLVGGQIDAVITDYDFAQKEVRRLNRPCRVIPLEAADYPQDYRGMRVDQYGIAVAKPETDLLERINNALDAAKRQNVLQTLKSRYVNRDISSFVLQPLPVEPANPTPVATPMMGKKLPINVLRR